MSNQDLKIISWNVGGAIANMIKKELVVEFIINLGSGVVMVQEPGDLTNEEIQELKMIFQRSVGQVKIVYQRTKMRYGGTMTIIIGSWVNRIHSLEMDERKLCRFITVRLRGKEGKLISLLNLYRPHFHSKGIYSVVERTRRYLEEEELDEYDPEGLWEKDLERIVTNEATNSAMIIAGDFNKRLEDKIAAWETLEREGQLYNVLKQKYGNNIPATRTPGETGAIDHMYITRQMIVRDIEILKETELSDHIPITATIIGHDWFYYITQKNTYTNRILNSNNPKAIKKFREILDTSLKENMILEKLKELQRAVVDGAEDGDRVSEEFSDIVTEVDKLTIAAEEKALGPSKNTRNLSKEERRIRYEIICWGKLVAWCRYSGPNRWRKTTMKRILRHIDKKESELKTITLEQATQGLKQAWGKWREREETKWRTSNEWRYYDEAIGRQALGDTREVETIIATLKHQGTTKTMHARIKQARGKNHGDGLTILEVEEADGTKSQIYQKEQIERIAMQECYKKVHTADKTTLWKTEVVEVLKTDKGPEQWRELYLSQDLRQRYSKLQISKGAKLFIEEIIRIPEIEEDNDFDTEQYWESWKRQREKTASNGKINFSHFMCVEKNSLANEIRTQIARIRLNTGMTPRSYKTATDLLLLKQPNDFRPHRMRLITLQHAASNHDFKYIGKQMNKIGEKLGLFSECQYGSRNKKSAAIQALNKSLLIDISRAKKRSIAIIANDAKSCYDRIVLWVLYFTMRKFGMSHEIAKTSVETIQDMVHKVSTVHGISDTHYGGTGTLPNGVLQGNGFAAQAWAAISSILLKIYENEGYGTEIRSAMEDKIIHLAGMAFVDDTDLMDIERENESIYELIQRVQDGIDLWSQLIEVTGGALEPRKTDWCLVRYTKIKGKWKTQSMEAKITLEDEDSKQRLELKRLQHDEARRTLGIWQRGDGGQQKQKEILIDNIRCYGKQIKTSGLSRREKELGLKSTITRTIAYGAPATSLNKAQAEEVNKELRKAAIQGLGVPKTTPLELIHGPSSLNGLQILDYCTFQMSEHIKILMDNLDTNTRTGELLQMLIAEHTIELGMEGSIWEIENEMYLDMISESWIKNTIQAMIEHNVQIRQYDPIQLKQWRRGDKFLMDAFLRIPGSKLNKEQLRNIQEVRRFLQVNTLSDILVNGMINAQVWEGISADMSISKHKYVWMKAVRPNQQEIVDWQYALSLIGIHGPNRRIVNTLGSWYDDAETIEAWTDRTLNYISIKKEDTTLYYEKERSSRNRNIQQLYRLTNTMVHMEKAWQVRVGYVEDKIQLFDIKRDIVKRTRRESEQYMNTIELKAPIETLDKFAEKIQEGSAIVVTDASDDKKGNLVAAFGEQLPMLKEMDEDALEGWTQIPANIDDADSYRGELGGILAAIRFTIQIAAKRNITKGTCEIKLDSYAALQKVQMLLDEGYPQSTSPSFDILRIIWKEMSETNIRFKFAWVRGHQDRNTPYLQLTDDARANCKADKIAASKISMVQPIEKPIHDAYEGPYLSIGKKKIHTNIHKKILEYVNGRRLKQYWIRRGRFSEEHEDLVDWEALAAANKSLRFSDRVILMKILSNKAPTAEIMKQRQQYQDEQCPICNQVKETQAHIFQCTDKEMQEAYEQGVKEMEKRLRRNKIIDERIIKTCVTQVHNARNGNDMNLWELCTDQRILGTEAFLQGIIHMSLREYCSGLIGTRRIILEIFRLRLALWKRRCHLMNNREHNKKREEYLKRQYEGYFQTPPRMMSEIDKGRYMIESVNFMRMTIHEKETWIKAMSKIKKKYERLAKKGILRYFQPKRNQEEGGREDIQPKKQKMITKEKTQRRQSRLSMWRGTMDTGQVHEQMKRKRIQSPGETTIMIKRMRDAKGTQDKITRWIVNQHNPGE